MSAGREAGAFYPSIFITRRPLNQAKDALDLRPGDIYNYLKGNPCGTGFFDKFPTDGGGGYDDRDIVLGKDCRFCLTLYPGVRNGRKPP